MKIFYSLALRPGKTGTYFYNKMFEMEGIDATYEALQCDDLELVTPELRSIKQLSGISITMPHKRQIIKYLDEVDDTVLETGACNTVVVRGDVWKGYNTDLDGVKWASMRIEASHTTKILGNGAMGALFASYFNLVGKPFELYSRSLGNWSKRHEEHPAVVNATSLGTLNSLSPLEHLLGAQLVIDLSLEPGELHKQANTTGAKYVSGIEFYKRVFLSQYEKYIGIKPNPELFDSLNAARTRG